MVSLVSDLRAVAKSVVIVDADGELVQFTASNPVPVAAQVSASGMGQTGVLSTLNSTSTPLGANAVYVGIEEENGFTDIGTYCIADQDGTLFYQFKDLNDTWHNFPSTGFVVTANSPKFHTAVKLSRPFRVRYVNGSVAQSTFSLQTFYGPFRQGNAPLNSNIPDDADAIVVRSIPADLDLALGRIGGESEGQKFGGVKGIDAIDNTVDVWRLADDALANRSDRKTFPTSAQSLYISSDSLSDTDVDVLIDYLDANGALQTITVNLNGQTAVDVGVTALDSNRLIVTNENQNVGNVYLNTANAHTSGVPNDLATVLAFIPAAKGQTQQAFDTVPIGHKYRIKRLIAHASRAQGAAGSADIELQVMPNGGSWLTKRDIQITTAAPYSESQAGLVFDALTHIRAVCVDVSDTDTNISVEWQFDLVTV